MTPVHNIDKISKDLYAKLYRAGGIEYERINNCYAQCDNHLKMFNKTYLCFER